MRDGVVVKIVLWGALTIVIALAYWWRRRTPGTTPGYTLGVVLGLAALVLAIAATVALLTVVL